MSTESHYAKSRYITLTSDSNTELYPENTTSVFRVRLADQFIVNPEEWKVALVDIRYPYSFNNIGPDSAVHIYDGYDIHKINFPSWYCDKKDHIVSFLDTKIKSIIRSSGTFNITDINAEFKFSLDPLKRTRLKCKYENFDIGISENIRDILGFGPELSMEEFYKRVQGKLLVNKSRSTAEHPVDTKRVLSSENTVLRVVQEYFKNTASAYKYENMFTFIMGDTFNKSGDITTAYLLYRVLIADKTLTHEELAEGYKQFNMDEKPYLTNWPYRSQWFRNNFDLNDFEQFVARVEYESGLDSTSVERKENVFGPKHDDILYIMTVVSLYVCKTLYTRCLFPDIVYNTFIGQLNPYEVLFIYTDIVTPEPFNGISSPLLAITRNIGEPGHLSENIFISPQYKQINKSDLTNIKILIAGVNGEPIPFTRGPAILTLHFIKQNTL